MNVSFVYRQLQSSLQSLAAYGSATSLTLLPITIVFNIVWRLRRAWDFYNWDYSCCVKCQCSFIPTTIKTIVNFPPTGAQVHVNQWLQSQLMLTKFALRKSFQIRCNNSLFRLNWSLKIILLIPERFFIGRLRLLSSISIDPSLIYYIQTNYY